MQTPCCFNIFQALIKALCVVMFCTVTLSACDSSTPSDNAQRRQQVVQVNVETIEFTTELTRVEAVGTSRALSSITIHPATSGEVVAVHFQPGQFVNEGDILVELDQRDAKLAVELAQIKVQDTERLYQRYRKSADSGATVPTTLDAAKTAHDSATIELGRAQVNLDDRSVEAPFSGFVGITDVDRGDRIQPTTTITTLDDRSKLLVSFVVPEVLVGKISIGNKVNIGTWNANRAEAFGEVIDIDSRINPETRTFITRAQVDNSDDALRPGMSFRVTMEIQGETYPVLPEVALQWGTEGSYVWTIVNGEAERLPVNIVQRQQGKVLVDATISETNMIIVEGIQRLRPGLKVEIKNSPQPKLNNDKSSGMDKSANKTETAAVKMSLFASIKESLNKS